MTNLTLISRVKLLYSFLMHDLTILSAVSAEQFKLKNIFTESALASDLVVSLLLACNARLIIELAIRSGKPFQAA